MWYAASAYAVWGLFPIYWKWLHAVAPAQLLSHRIIWSWVLLTLIIVMLRQVGEYRREVARPRVLRTYAIAAVLVSANWLTYVWAVNAGHVVQTSLGYFINPLISILLGVVFLRERLRPWQWVAICVAASGVVFLAIEGRQVPWIAITLAVTFGLYGMVKKMAPLSSVHGLALETAILAPVALGYLVFTAYQGSGAFLELGATTDLLLVGAGVVTTAPLLMFATAAKRIPLTWLGILQYIAPTIQFLLGVFLYHEPLSAARLAGFIIVWAALAIFAVEGALAHRPVAFPATSE